MARGDNAAISVGLVLFSCASLVYGVWALAQPVELPWLRPPVLNPHRQAGPRGLGLGLSRDHEGPQNRLVP